MYVADGYAEMMPLTLFMDKRLVYAINGEWPPSTSTRVLFLRTWRNILKWATEILEKRSDGF